MKINLDDPKLTAYALGELSGAERIELEKAIAESPEAQTYVDDLRGFSLRLKSEYDAEREAQEIHPTNIIPIAEPDARGRHRVDWHWRRQLLFLR